MSDEFPYVEIPKVEMTLPQLLDAVRNHRVAVSDFPNGFGTLRELVSAHPDARTIDDDPETAENIARSVRLTMPVMGIHPHNQDWINEHIARLVELANERWPAQENTS